MGSQTGVLPPGIEAGSLGKRFVSYIIDGLVPSALSAAAGVVAYLQLVEDPTVILVLAIAVGVVVLGWAVLCWWMLAAKGATPGMKIMKLQFVSLRNGKPVGWGRALLRQVVLGVLVGSSIGAIVLLITVFTDVRRQGLHDKAGGGVVIKERSRTARAGAPAREASSTGHPPGAAQPPSGAAPVGLPAHLQPGAGFAPSGQQWAGSGFAPESSASAPEVGASQFGFERPPGGEFGGPSGEFGRPAGEFGGSSGQFGQPAGDVGAPGRVGDQPPGVPGYQRPNPQPTPHTPLHQQPTPRTPLHQQPAPQVQPSVAPAPQPWGGPSVPQPFGTPQDAQPAQSQPAPWGTPAEPGPITSVPFGFDDQPAQPEPTMPIDLPGGGAAGGFPAGPPPAGFPNSSTAGTDERDRFGRPTEEPARPPVDEEPDDGTRLIQRAGHRAPDQGWTIALDDGRHVKVESLVLIGRNPQPRPGEEQAELVKVGENARTVSKTHLAVGVDNRGIWVSDRGSTNGSAIATNDGGHEPCAPGEIVRVREGQIVSFGEHRLEIQRATS